jgi:hypothetical protein
LTGGTLTGGLIGTTGSFSSGGSGDTFTIGHTSGSGIALNITKCGNGEGLYINKASGSGNAATIIGTLNATTLVKSGGTASQFLKADGSVDSSTYLTTASASSTYLPLAGGTLTGALSGTSATFSGSVTATSTSSLFKEGYIIRASTTSGGGSQPAYTYYTAAGSKRWSSFLDVGSDKFHIANAANSELFTITQAGNISIGSTVDAGFKTYIKAGASGLLLSAGTTSGDNALLIQNAAETTTLFNIKGDGAATFTSSVSASSFNTSSKSNISQNSGTVPAGTATAIFTKSGSNGGGFVLVTGRTAAGDWFFDTVAFNNDNSANAVSSQNGGGPPARSYSVSGSSLRVTVSTALSSFYCFGLSASY